MSLEKIQMLEARISEVLEYIKVLQREKAEIEHKLQETQQAIERYREMEEEYNRMKEERGEVRSRIEHILEELKSVGGE